MTIHNLGPIQQRVKNDMILKGSYEPESTRSGDQIRSFSGLPRFELTSYDMIYCIFNYFVRTATVDTDCTVL